MATITKESKPGYLTTEFWLVVVANVLSQAGALEISDKYKSIVLFVTLVGYTISRGLAKQGVPDTTTTTPGA